MQKNYKYGHAVIRKGDYIYCPNERRTYKAKKYLEAFETKVFKEISLEQYKIIKRPIDIAAWIDNPKEVTISKYMHDEFENFRTFCEENGGFRSPEDKQN